LLYVFPHDFIEQHISTILLHLQYFQTGLINNKCLTNEILFTLIYHLLTKKEEENLQINTKNKTFNSLIEEQNKYHLIPSEPKGGHVPVAESIKHIKKKKQIFIF